MAGTHDWKGQAGDGWAQEWRRTDRSFGGLTERLLSRTRDFAFSSALDIGCGAGELSLAIGRGRPHARVIGVDISRSLIEVARKRGERLLNVDFELSDAAQWQPSSGFSPQLLVSRHGVMFFDDPVAAFTNLRAAAAPGARLAFVCWRDDEHEMFELGLGALRRHLPDGALPAPIVGAPGPLGFGDRSRVEEVLFGAGWGQIAIEPVDVPCDYGVDGSDGVDARLAVALSGSVGRAARAQLEPEVGPEGWDAIVAEMRDELLARRTGGTIQLLAHLWLVTAINPA